MWGSGVRCEALIAYPLAAREYFKLDDAHQFARKVGRAVLEDWHVDEHVAADVVHHFGPQRGVHLPYHRPEATPKPTPPRAGVVAAEPGRQRIGKTLAGDKRVDRLQSKVCMCARVHV